MANDKYVLAIDLGTSGCKAALVSVHGRVAAWCFHSVETRILPGGGADSSQGPGGALSHLTILILESGSHFPYGGFAHPDQGARDLAGDLDMVVPKCSYESRNDQVADGADPPQGASSILGDLPALVLEARHEGGYDLRGDGTDPPQRLDGR